MGLEASHGFAELDGSKGYWLLSLVRESDDEVTFEWVFHIPLEPSHSWAYNTIRACEKELHAMAGLRGCKLVRVVVSCEDRRLWHEREV